MKKIILGVAAFLVPVVSFAQTTSGAGGLFYLLSEANAFVNKLIPFIIALTVLFFIIGIFRYVMAGSDEGKQGEARKFMIFSIIALFVMVSVWGLVNILVGTLNLNNNAPPPPTTYNI